MTRILPSRLAFEQFESARQKPFRFVSFAMLLLAASNVFTHSQSLAIRHVTVIDAAGHDPQPDMTVVVERDRIISVGPSNKKRLPKESVTVNGTGKFLIPGLWDMHVHGASDDRAAWSHLLFIANGVVGVRDMSGPPDARAWHASQSSNADPSPTIYLGSPIVDGPNPVWPDSLGFGIHDELALLVDAGLPPMAALETATRNAALFMGQLNQRGTIEVGKIADLVLLDKDPLINIRNTRSIRAVVLNGKLYSRSDLDAMLARARVLASRQKSVRKK
jgi:adenine deaminase